MVILTNTTTQTLQPGQSLTFDSMRQTGNSEYVRGSGASQVFLKSGGLFLVDFSCNATNTASTAQVQIQAELDGAALPETLRVFTPSAINAVGTLAFNTSVSTSTPSCNFDLGATAVTITNTGEVAITISNPSLRIGRVG